MESLQTIKARRVAVRSIGQITKAMEVVAATKMRKAQEVALASRPFSLKSLELLAKISKNAPFTSPLAEQREVKTTLLLLVSSDRGLAGAFNTQVFRKVDELFSTVRSETSSHRYLAITVGKKAAAYAARKHLDVRAAYHGFGDAAEPEAIREFSKIVTDGFLTGEWDQAIVISTHFRTTLSQEVIVREILPVHFDQIRSTIEEIIPEHGRWAELTRRERVISVPESDTDYIFEPSPAAVLEKLVPELVATQLYHLILEANASEHSARRVAMKSASDNAKELDGALTIELNKARQATITKELIEITSTQSAMNG